MARTTLTEIELREAHRESAMSQPSDRSPSDPMGSIRDANPENSPFPHLGDGGNERHTQYSKSRNGGRSGERERGLTACSARDGLPSSSSARARDSMLHPSPAAAGAGAGTGGSGVASISTSGGSIGGALDPARRLSFAFAAGWGAVRCWLATAAAAVPCLQIRDGNGEFPVGE